MQVWHRTGLWPIIQQTRANTGTVTDCVFAILQHHNNEDSQRFAVTLWSLWKHRNLKLWQDVDETPTQVIDRAFHLIENWRAANSVTDRAPVPRTPLHGRPRGHHELASSTTSPIGWQRPQRILMLLSLILLTEQA
jgi:hypothetical protein